GCAVTNSARKDAAKISCRFILESMPQREEYLGGTFTHRFPVRLNVYSRVQIESQIETYRSEGRLKPEARSCAMSEASNGEIPGALKDVSGVIKERAAQFSN